MDVRSTSTDLPQHQQQQQSSRSRVQTLISNSPALKSIIWFRRGMSSGGSGNTPPSSDVDAAGGGSVSSPKVRQPTSADTPPTVGGAITVPSHPTPRSRNLTFDFSSLRHRRHKPGYRGPPGGVSSEKSSIITMSSHLSFVDFVDLFRSFVLHMRKDLLDMFEQNAVILPPPPPHPQQQQSSSSSTPSPVGSARLNSSADGGDRTPVLHSAASKVPTRFPSIRATTGTYRPCFLTHNCMVSLG